MHNSFLLSMKGPEKLLEHVLISFVIEGITAKLCSTDLVEHSLQSTTTKWLIHIVVLLPSWLLEPTDFNKSTAQPLSFFFYTAKVISWITAMQCKRVFESQIEQRDWARREACLFTRDALLITRKRVKDNYRAVLGERDLAYLWIIGCLVSSTKYPFLFEQRQW